jgi:hypothetical protein
LWDKCRELAHGEQNDEFGPIIEQNVHEHVVLVGEEYVAVEIGSTLGALESNMRLGICALWPRVERTRVCSTVVTADIR